MIEMSLRQSESVALPEQPAGGSWRSVLAHMLVTTLMIVADWLVFVPAVLFHCALRSGRRAAWLTGIAAIAIVAINVAVHATSDVPLMRMAWANLAGIGFAVVLPSLAALPLVEKGVKFGRLLTLLLLGSTTGLLAVEFASRALAAFSPFGFLVAQTRELFTAMSAAGRKNGADELAMLRFERVAGYMADNMMVSSMLIGLTIMFVLSLLMIGRLPAWRERVARSENANELAGSFLFRNFALPDWVLLAFIVGGLAPLTTGLWHKVTVTALVMAIFLYLLQGLAISRFVLVSIGSGLAGWLLLALVTLTIGPMLFAFTGLFDPFFDFRHYKKRKDDSHESHSD